MKGILQELCNKTNIKLETRGRLPVIDEFVKEFAGNRY